MGMVSSLSISKRQEFLEMTIQGTYDYWEFMEYPDLISKACKDNGCDKILIDVTPVMAEEVALIELFFLGERIAQVFKDKVTLALVWRKESLSDFLVDVATNRSARLKVFDDPKLAQYWLTQKY